MLGPCFATGAGVVYRWKTGVRLADIQPHRHATYLKIPTLIAHGTSDHVVSVASGRRLFDSIPASTPKKWLEIPGADHDNVLVTDFPIYAEIAAWMLRNVKPM